MPTGSSNGANRQRASTSHSTTKAAPSSMAAGSRMRWLLPTSRRAMCGASSPTKLSSPAKLTAAPASSAASEGAEESRDNALGLTKAEAAAMLAEDPLLEAPEHALLEQQVQQMFEKAGAMN